MLCSLQVAERGHIDQLQAKRDIVTVLFMFPFLVNGKMHVTGRFVSPMSNKNDEYILQKHKKKPNQTKTIPSSCKFL